MVGSYTFPANSQSEVGEQRSPVQITTRQDYLLGLINALVGAGLYKFPDSSSTGTLDKVLVSGGDGTTNWQFGFRSNTDLENDAGQGSAGQVIQSDGDGTLSWLSIVVTTAWTAKTIPFTTANQGRYVLNAGIAATLHTPAGANEEFTIRPQIGQNFETSPATLARAATEKIANVSATFTMDLNAEYTFITDGTDWDVIVKLIGRA